MFQPLARLVWDSAEATLVDQRFIERGAYQSQSGSRTNYQVWEYMLDVPGPDGTSVRLTTKEKSFWLPNGVKAGDQVPVLVNRKRTKVEIDRKTIAGRGDASRKAGEEARRAEDEARFREKMDGHQSN